MIIVGLSALYHDAACAVMVDGRLTSAAQEERFTRRRFDERIPINAFMECLRGAGIGPHDIDHIGYYERPAVKLERQLWQFLPDLPPSHSEAMFRLDADRPFREIRERLGYEGPISCVAHHEAHAASAFYFSGFDESALFTADAVGEWTTTSYGTAGGYGIHLFEEIRFPHSLGLLYSTVTSYLGFEVNSDEYKVMGLAPYGTPTLTNAVWQLLEILPAGGFQLALEFFNLSGGPMYTPALCELFGSDARASGDEITSFHENLAASLQVVLEEVLLQKVHYLHERTGIDNLSYAGGVALNCVANARIRRDGPFSDLFVQPAAGDAGGAVGAAAAMHHRLARRLRTERLGDARLGPAVTAAEARTLLECTGTAFRDYSNDQAALIEYIADRLASGDVVGWCDGPMEFGPRALGSRSILADPRTMASRDRVNERIKQREAFRPFAPAVVAERSSEFFDLAIESPFMLETCQVKSDGLPAVTHVDGSARVQTVDARRQPRFHALLTEFGRRTGFPVLLNTSFNVRGEPIVCTVADALGCFLRTGIDLLVVDGILVRRADVSRTLVDRAMAVFEPGSASTRDVYTFL